jgi:hypothetical protein
MHLGSAGMGQQSWEGRAGGVDLSTDLPDDTRALLVHVTPSIDSVERIYSLIMPAERLSQERER